MHRPSIHGFLIVCLLKKCRSLSLLYVLCFSLLCHMGADVAYSFKPHCRFPALNTGLSLWYNLFENSYLKQYVCIVQIRLLKCRWLFHRAEDYQWKSGMLYGFEILCRTRISSGQNLTWLAGVCTWIYQAKNSSQNCCFGLGLVYSKWLKILG